MAQYAPTKTGRASAVAIRFPLSSSPKVYCDYYIDDRNIGTPLTDKGYVDWNKMLVLLRQKNLL